MTQSNEYNPLGLTLYLCKAIHLSLLEVMSLNLFDEDLGICYNLEKHLWDWGARHSLGYDFVKKYAKGWEHHTGVEDYPVPINSNGYTLWEGKYLQLRLDLCQHMLKKLDLTIKSLNNKE